MEYLEYFETPVQELVHPLLKQKGIQLLIKREDLNHPVVSGNKWWKLKYNIQEANNSRFKTLLTFGGAFSNHIYATAGAAFQLGFKSIGIIRGEIVLPLNPTLSFASQHGMSLRFISRADYKRKTSPEFIEHLKETFEGFFLIPEGGTNEYAVKGTLEFSTIINDVPGEYVFLPVGTGGTIAGVIAGLKDKTVIGIPVFKNAEYIAQEIKHLLQKISTKNKPSWSLWTNYHQGGYGKTTKSLIDFLVEMKNKYNLPLDHVYTGKMLYAVFEEIKAGAFPRGTTLLVIHTGGLQGSILF